MNIFRDIMPSFFLFTLVILRSFCYQGTPLQSQWVCSWSETANLPKGMHHVSKIIYLRQIKVTLRIRVQRPKIYQKNIFTYMSQCEAGVQVKKYPLALEASQTRNFRNVKLNTPKAPGCVVTVMFF